MDNRIIKFIFILLGLVLILALLYFLFINGFLSGKKPGQSENTPVVPSGTVMEKSTTTAPIAPAATAEPVKTQTEFTKDDLGRMAASFAERFGSFSNQSNFSNINDLKIFMTPKMQEWAKNFVVNASKDIGDSQIYFGITTKSVSREFKAYDPDQGQASVLVVTRRREARVSRANSSTVFTQEILINFLKEDGAWKVDSAFWKEK